MISREIMSDDGFPRKARFAGLYNGTGDMTAGVYGVGRGAAALTAGEIWRWERVSRTPGPGFTEVRRWGGPYHRVIKQT